MYTVTPSLIARSDNVPAITCKNLSLKEVGVVFFELISDATYCSLVSFDPFRIIGQQESVTTSWIIC